MNIASVYISYHDGLRWIGSTDIHDDVIILVKVDACLVVGKNGIFIFRECWGNICDLGPCRVEWNTSNHTEDGLLNSH